MKPLSLTVAVLLIVTGCRTAPDPKETAAPPEQQPAQPPMNAAASAGEAGGSATNSNPAQSDWVSTASGLRYHVIVSGPAGGRSPAHTDSVTVHYIGKLTDGTVFDSSVDRGQPANFGVSQVIPGWTEALKLMKPGDQWLLYIPSRLAYGNRAVGDKIPPNSDLIFKVALIHVAGRP